MGTIIKAMKDNMDTGMTGAMREWFFKNFFVPLILMGLEQD